MSKNLVELMAKKAYESSMTNEPRTWVTALPSIKDCYIVEAISMLSVVKEHIGEVAEPCPSCCDDYMGVIEDCKLCKGSGVIARTDGGGK